MRDIEDILVDYFAGEELSPEDMKGFEEWRNIELHADFLAVLQGMGEGKKVRKKIREAEGEGIRILFRKINNRKKRERRIAFSSIAAGLALLLGISLYYREKTVDTTGLTKEVAGQMNVRLKLADGQEVALHTNLEKVIVADSFSTITHKDHVLVYDQIKTKEHPEYHTLIIPVGAEYSLVLADGTKVYLNSDSEIRFPVAFSGEKREVYLTGEAYFEVAKDTSRVFQVHTADMTAIVLGTSFNIKSYPEQKYIATTLEKGRLKVVCDDQEYTMLPGHQVRYDKSARVAVMEKVNTTYYTSWKDGYYSFDGMMLEEVMDMLGKWYGLKVIYRDEEVKRYEFSGRLKRYEDYKYLLEKFEETGVVKFVINGDIIDIRKK